MLWLLSRLLKNKIVHIAQSTTTEYGNQENQENAKENETMARAKVNTKAETKVTENKTNEGEKTMQKAKSSAKKTATKGTTKTSANAKGETTVKATESKAKGTTKATEKKGSATMQNTEMMTANIDGIEITGTKEQVMEIIAAYAKAKEKANEGKVLSNETKKATEIKAKTSTKATKGKGTAKATVTESKPAKETKSATKGKGKSSAKKTATAKAEEPKTWTEKKAEYAKEKYTDEERAEYGFRKSLERKATKFAYEATNAKFEERVEKKEWTKAYKEMLGYITNALEDLFETSEIYTDEEIVRDFLGTVADKGIKKVRSDVKGYAKYVRA